MLSNAHFLAKFRFDTSETEPAKNLQILQQIANFADFATLTPTCPLNIGSGSTGGVVARGAPPRVLAVQVRPDRGQGGRAGARRAIQVRARSLEPGLDVPGVPARGTGTVGAFRAPDAELKGSIAEGPNQTNHSDQSSVRILGQNSWSQNSVRIQELLVGKSELLLEFHRNSKIRRSPKETII